MEGGRAHPAHGELGGGGVRERQVLGICVPPQISLSSVPAPFLGCH